MFTYALVVETGILVLLVSPVMSGTHGVGVQHIFVAHSLAFVSCPRSCPAASHPPLKCENTTYSPYTGKQHCLNLSSAAHFSEFILFNKVPGGVDVSDS